MRTSGDLPAVNLTGNLLLVLVTLVGWVDPDFQKQQQYPNEVITSMVHF